ncbi:MAG: alpha/beta hydrolase [Pseudomonadota bacterium]|jgi:hypothetical protein
MNYQPRRLPRHSTRLLRGLPHRITEWGEPSATPIILLHGWGDSGETFQFLVDACARESYWIALDWRGFGESASQGPSYWFPDYFADLDALLDAYSPERPVTLLGHSMGGNIAWMYAGIRPERVSCLVNLEGVGLSRTDPAAAPARYRRWLDGLQVAPTFSVYPSVAAFAQLLHKRNPRLPPERAHYIAQRWLMPCEGGYTLRWDPAHKRVNPVLYSRDGAEACWGAATARSLLVLGGRSEILAKLGADGQPSTYDGLYPSLSVVVLAEAGHMMHHEDPEALAVIIEAFLGQVL